jgi:hypothetical protein
MHQPSTFKLDEEPGDSGLRCDGSGLFLGPNALLERDDTGFFEPRPFAELQKILGHAGNDDTNCLSHIRSVELIAHALNKGDMARATMAAVLMRVSQPAAGINGLDDALAKAGFNPDEPRDERGQWTTGGDSTGSGTQAADRSPRIQLADAGESDAVNDPVAQAAAHAADAQSKQPSAQESMWQRLSAELLDRAEALLTTIGQGQINASDADAATVSPAETAIVDWLRAFN